MKAKTWLAMATACALGCAAPALANDSEAAVGVGGLTLVESKTVSLDYEDLYISADEVRITYRFTNHGKKDVDTLIAFPLPVMDPETAQNTGNYNWDTLDFSTTVDGKPIQLNVVDVALIDGRNVTALLKKYGWKPSLGYSLEDISMFERLPQKELDAAVKDGLLARDGKMVRPLWRTQRNITRKQKFPAGKTVVVTHRYIPAAGGSVAGGLDSQWREGKDGTRASYKREHCVDDDFLASFDRKLAARKKAAPYSLGYVETWVDYILSSGSNWKGPIKDFRLVVDKGDADRLVSFCMDGVKKISPTQFEVRKKNFEPKRDLSILIISWPEPEQ